MGPDARFGGLKGVIRTRVGYTGGKKRNPTYRSLGDHTESIQIDYDPSRISYEGLLDVFLSSHSPCRQCGSRQYMSAILYHDEAQRILATKALKAEAARRGSVVHTRLLALDRFYRAEDYHQKYYLRRRADLMKTFNAVFRRPIDFADATISMRVNAYLAGHGSLETVRRELEKHGLSESDAARIRAMLAQVESKRKQR